MRGLTVPVYDHVACTCHLDLTDVTLHHLTVGCSAVAPLLCAVFNLTSLALAFPRRVWCWKRTGVTMTL